LQVICGINPLLEVLASHPELIKKVVAVEGRGGDGVKKILRLAAEQGIPVEYGGRDQVERLAPRQVHQGIAAICNAYAYATVDEVVSHRQEKSKNDLLVLLDSVADPRNLGSIIRTAHCCGANGVIIPQDRAASVTTYVSKASAGAVHHLPIAKVVNLATTIEYLKERGFWIYGADAAARMDMRTPDYEEKIAVVMGSEGSGIRPLIRKKCDFLISIPMRGQVASLNVSVAAGVILFEILRKWGN
jgi:23S rRNA (guanosine2251-2'-O)-methyltransferase